MITQIDISNFRSIKQQSIPLKKLNILYGPNGSGKSSVMYAPYVMRNFFVNPNQRLNSLFNLGFINLGGFENVIRNKIRHSNDIEIKINLDIGGPSVKKKHVKIPFKYRLFLSEEVESEIEFAWSDLKKKITIDFPSTLQKKVEVDLGVTKLIWNGITFEEEESTIESKIFSSSFNGAYEEIKNIEIVPPKRGFTRAIFSLESEDDDTTEAFKIRDGNSDIESKIDHYFRRIFDKTFRYVAIPGSTSFYLRTQNNKGFTVDLVNEGYGINSTVSVLMKVLKHSTSLAFIEEPEIHLHPSAQAKLVDVFTEIVQKENKQIFLSTHSENIVSSVLAKIADRELSVDDVQFYLAQSENEETKIIPQEVNDKGQIEGGLMSFMETELTNLRKMLGV